MWLMLQQDEPEDYVIATGVTTTVRDFVKMAFQEIGVTLSFSGTGVDEVGVVVKSENPNYKLEVGKEIVSVDPSYFRPTEVELLIGDPTKAKEKLGWTLDYNLNELVSEMVKADLELFKKDKLLKDAGFEIKNEYE